MGEHARPKKTRGLAGSSRLHEAAEAAARAGGMLLRSREAEAPSPEGAAPGVEDERRDGFDIQGQAGFENLLDAQDVPVRLIAKSGVLGLMDHLEPFSAPDAPVA